MKRWRVSVGRHGHGEVLWGTCISVLRPLEISVVDIGSSINENACIRARGVLFTWDLQPPPLFLGVLEDNLAKNCTAFVMQADDVTVGRVDVSYVCLKWSAMYVA